VFANKPEQFCLCQPAGQLSFLNGEDAVVVGKIVMSNNKPLALSTSQPCLQKAVQGEGQQASMTLKTNDFVRNLQVAASKTFKKKSHLLSGHASGHMQTDLL